MINALKKGMLGKKHTIQTRKKMSTSHTGKKLSPEHKIKLSIVHKLKPNKYWLGKKRTHMSGKNHWAWKEDRNSLVKKQQRSDSAYVAWRRTVFLRDNHECKISNKDCKGRIEAHHILGWHEHPNLRYDINNGITLCHAHHPRKRAEEKRLSPYFKDLVSVSKEIN